MAENLVYKGISATIGIPSTVATITKDINSLQNIDASIGLCVMEYITNATDNIINSISNWQSLLNTFVSVSTSKNIKISMLKPHIGSYAEGDGFSRFYFNPKDKNIFFANWKTILLRYANFCNVNNIPILCIECEMSRVDDSAYFSNWKSIVDSIRASYPNLKLTLATIAMDVEREIATKEMGKNSIFDLVDYIGVNSYATIPRENSVNGYMNFEYLFDELVRLWDKKILITENGCTSWSDKTNTKNIFPIYIGSDNDYNYIDQYKYLQAFYEYAFDNDNLLGIFLWHISDPFDFLNYNNSVTLTKQYFGTRG